MPKETSPVPSPDFVRRDGTFDEGRYVAYYAAREQARAAAGQAAPENPEAQQVAERSAAAIQQVQAPYRLLAENAREAGNEDLRGTLELIAREAGEEAQVIIGQPQEATDRLRTNENLALIPDRTQGSIKDIRALLPVGSEHIAEAAVGISRALQTEGEAEIPLTAFDLSTEPVSTPGGSPQISEGTALKAQDVLIMLGAANPTQVTDPVVGADATQNVVHYETKTGLTLRQTVRFHQRRARGRTDAPSLVDTSRPVSLAFSVLRTPQPAAMQPGQGVVPAPRQAARLAA